MSKSKHLAMQSIQETSAEQTLFPTEVGPNSPVSEEVLGAVRVSGGVDEPYLVKARSGVNNNRKEFSSSFRGNVSPVQVQAQ